MGTNIRDRRQTSYTAPAPFSVSYADYAFLTPPPQEKSEDKNLSYPRCMFLQQKLQ
jgi:hypothetical protein